MFTAWGIARCRLSTDLLLLVSVASLPLTLLALSFTRTTTELIIIMSFMGMAMGIIDCLANLQLVHIYDKAVAPFLQVRLSFPASMSMSYRGILLLC